MFAIVSIAVAAAGEVSARSQSGDCKTGSACAEAAYEAFQSLKDPADMTKVLRLAVRGCELESGVSCRLLGAFYEMGQGVPIDIPRAVALFERGCDLRYAQACSAAAGHYYDGNGVAKNQVKGTALFEKACALGDVAACSIADRILRQEEEKRKEAPQARGVFVSPGAQQSTQAQSATSERAPIVDPNSEEEPTEAESNAPLALTPPQTQTQESSGTPLCTSAELCLRNGQAFLNGEGGPPDAVRARVFFTAACDFADPEGCVQAGNLWRQGLDQPPNMKRALPFYEKGCAFGVGAACFSAGEIYLKGPEEVLQDDKSARDFFEAACGLNYAMGCTLVGAIYANGRGGVEVDLQKALEQMLLGCELGDGQGCFVAAQAYANGEGVPQNMRESQWLMTKACSLGKEKACQSLGR